MERIVERPGALDVHKARRWRACASGRSASSRSTSRSSPRLFRACWRSAIGGGAGRQAGRDGGDQRLLAAGGAPRGAYLVGWDGRAHSAARRSGLSEAGGQPDPGGAGEGGSSPTTTRRIGTATLGPPYLDESASLARTPRQQARIVDPSVAHLERVVGHRVLARAAEYGRGRTGCVLPVRLHSSPVKPRDQSAAGQADSRGLGTAQSRRFLAVSRI